MKKKESIGLSDMKKIGDNAIVIVDDRLLLHNFNGYSEVPKIVREDGFSSISYVYNYYTIQGKDLSIWELKVSPEFDIIQNRKLSFPILYEAGNKRGKLYLEKKSFIFRKNFQGKEDVREREWGFWGGDPNKSRGHVKTPCELWKISSTGYAVLGGIVHKVSIGENLITSKDLKTYTRGRSYTEDGPLEVAWSTGNINGTINTGKVVYKEDPWRGEYRWWKE